MVDEILTLAEYLENVKKSLQLNISVARALKARGNKNGADAVLKRCRIMKAELQNAEGNA